MELTIMDKANKDTSVRIKASTNALLKTEKRRLSALAARNLDADDVIRVMHAVFEQTPEAVIVAAVQP